MAKDEKKLEKSAEAPESLPSSAVSAVLEKAGAPQPVISFDRWFATTGKPEHWKHGMKAFASTDGKKTVAAWDAIFKSY